MVHVYCGDGKGKTTCAMGLALRAIGRGSSVVIVQFLKGSSSGEIMVLESLPGVKVFRLQEELPFTFKMTDSEKKMALLQHNRIFQQAIHFANAGFCDMLILDEICSAWETDLVEKKMVTDFLDCKPDKLELIITGRNPPECFIDIADYMTEMTLKKHPYKKGVSAREGIEF